MVEIRRCGSRSDWRLFERVPEVLHGKHPHFVPPVPGDVAKLRGPKHPFAASGNVRAYVAFRHGQPVGRIASIVNRVHNEYHQDRTGFFGFFDFADEDAAAPLLDQARQDLAAQQRDLIRGPFNPTQMDECGLHVEGFGERPFFGMPFNPPWYREVYESLGLVGARDLLAYSLTPDLEASFDDRLGPLVERLRARLAFRVRPIDMTRLDTEAPLVARLFNESLAREWNFMPLSVELAHVFARELAGQLDADAVLIAEAEGQPAGLSIVLPDLNEFLADVRRLPRWLRLPRLAWLLKTRHCARGRWAVFGMLPEYQKRGATMLLVYEAIKRARPRYESGELSWTQDINPDVNRLAGALGLTPSKRYRIYETTP